VPSMSNTTRIVSTALVVLMILGAIALRASSTMGAQVDEFHQPSWTELPPPSSENTTPSCPLTAANDYQCEVAASALPPRDSNNTAAYLNSGYWPSEKRPDIEVYAANWFPTLPGESCLQHLAHYCYLVDAERAGYPVTHSPEVGDLWFAQGQCIAWGGPSGPAPTSGCMADQSWYMGYVEQVFPDGSFIQSWGGSTTPADSGLAVTWFSGAMDAYTDFVPLMPQGTPLPVPVNARPPVVGGATEVGGQLELRDAGTWHNEPSASFVPRRYFWMRCNPAGANCNAIPGTASEVTVKVQDEVVYQVTAADTGHTLRLAETAENVAGVGNPALSAPIAVPSKARVPRGAGLAGRVSGISLVLYVRGALIGQAAHVTFALRTPDGRTLRAKRRITLTREMHLSPSGRLKRSDIVEAATIAVGRFNYAGRSFAGRSYTFRGQ